MSDEPHNYCESSGMACLKLAETRRELDGFERYQEQQEDRIMLKLDLLEGSLKFVRGMLEKQERRIDAIESRMLGMDEKLDQILKALQPESAR
jgi:chromosome segregation ATPase